MADDQPLKLAIVTTIWEWRSHANHMGERFLNGFPRNGRWHRPSMEVAGLFVEQVNDDDLSRKRAADHGFEIYPTIAAALRLGGNQLAVDAVLLIAEHGDYPENDKGQKLYPRYEYFAQIVDVFKEDGRAVPVFNDKHLSYSFAKAQRMVAASEELHFPFLAGSSLPVTFRLPPVELPPRCDLEEALMVGCGNSDAMDYHALEAMQCMVERRRDGETGVSAVQLIEGDEVWQAGTDGRWSRRLLEAALARSDSRSGIALTDGRPQDLAHSGELEELVENPAAYLIEYNDGLRATMLMLSGAVQDYTFAAELTDGEVVSTQFLLPTGPNVVYSACLMGKVEEMITTGCAPYPVERTLLVSGMLERCLESRLAGHGRLLTPELNVCYNPPATSQFCEPGESYRGVRVPLRLEVLVPELELISTLSAAPFALWEQEDGRLMVAGTDGLSVCIDGVVNAPAGGPIDAATRGPDGRVYCTRGDRILRFDPDGEGKTEDITSAFAGHPQGGRGISCTGYGEIWVEGCSTRRLVDGSFAPTPAFHAAKSAPPVFPPAAALVDMHGCHWALSNREQDRQLFFLPVDALDAWQIAWLEAGQWDFLIADSVGYIWIAGADGWRRFCPRRAENGWQDIGDDLPSTKVSALALSPDELVLAAFSGGELLELNADASGGTVVRTLATLPGPARCIHTGRDGAIWIATEDGLYRREPEADAWQRNWEQKRGRLPVGGNHDIFAAECRGRLWVAGGWACAWGFPVRNYVGDELFAYDWESEYWEIVSHMYMPRRYNGIAEMEDRVWIVGGETCFPGRSGEEQALYIVDIYDPASGTWSAGPALNYVRTDPFVVSCNGRIYAIGGAGHNSGPKLDTVESIGPGETSWRLEPPLPEPTRQGHACVLKGVIYCLSIDGVFAFDTSSGRWEEALPQPGAIGQGPLAAAYRGEVWLIGGHGDRRIHCFNPETRTWRSGPDLPTEQAWGAAAVMNGRLLVVGGAHESELHRATVYDDRTYVLREPGGW